MQAITLFNFLGFDINFGTFIFVFGLALAIAISFKNKASVDSASIGLSWLIGLVFALLFSHWLYSLLRFNYAYHDKGVLYMLLPNQGGFTVYGAMLGVAISLYIVSKIKKINFLKLLDVFFIPAFVIIAFERFAEGIWFQGFGRFVENELLCFFPISIYDANWEYWLFAIFMLEGLFALVCALLLSNKKPKKLGYNAFSFISLYASFQLMFESMRQDEVLKWGFVICNQVISALILLSLLIYFIKTNSISAKKASLIVVAFIACIAVIGAMEFALESRIIFLENFSHIHCYIVDILAIITINILLHFAKNHKAKTAKA